MLLVGSRILGLGIQLGNLLILAHNLDVPIMGMFSIYLATTAVVRALGPFGIDQASTRLIAIEIKERRKSDRILEISLVGGLALVAISAALCVGLYGTMAIGMFSQSYDANQRLIFLLALPAFAGIGLVLGQIRGLGHNLLAQIPELIGIPALFFLQLVVLLLFDSLSLTLAMLSIAISAWAILGLQISVRIKLGLRKFRWPSLTVTQETLSESWRIFQAHTLTVASLQAPVFLTALLLGPASVAIFDVAQKIGYLPSMLTASVGATFNPHLAVAASSKDWLRTRRLIFDAGVMAGVPAFIFFVLAFLFGPALLDFLFPSAYTGAAMPIVFLSAATTMNAILGPFSNFFLMSNRAPIVRTYSAASLVLILFGCWALGGSLGVVGVSVAAMAGRLFKDIGLAREFRKLWTRVQARA